MIFSDCAASSRLTVAKMTSRRNLIASERKRKKRKMWMASIWTNKSTQVEIFVLVNLFFKWFVQSDPGLLEMFAVADLRALCKHHGLSSSGTKPALKERLEHHYNVKAPAKKPKKDSN
jgi:hypothetical protein